jgi:hypothetical protein
MLDAIARAADAAVGYGWGLTCGPHISPTLLKLLVELICLGAIL